MTALRTQDPSLGDALESAFRRLLAPFGGDGEGGPLRMRLDIAEAPDLFEVKADLPGVRKDDIEVRVHANVVQIDAELEREKEARTAGRIVRSERYHGRVSRSFSLAQDIDEARVTARYEQGVLTLSLPKKAPDASRQVQIPIQ